MISPDDVIFKVEDVPCCLSLVRAARACAASTLLRSQAETKASGLRCCGSGCRRGCREVALYSMSSVDIGVGPRAPGAVRLDLNVQHRRTLRVWRMQTNGPGRSGVGVMGKGSEASTSLDVSIEGRSSNTERRIPSCVDLVCACLFHGAITLIRQNHLLRNCHQS